MTPQEKPNIILVVLDSARRDMFGCYGNTEGLTPHIDAWAKEGVIGKYNYSGGNGSAMGHTCIFSGQHASRHQMVHNLTEMNSNITMIPTFLKLLGYRSFGHLQMSFIPPAGYNHIFAFDELVYPGNTGALNAWSFKKNSLELVKSHPWLWDSAKKVYGKIFGDEGRVKAAAKTFDGFPSIQYLMKKLKENRGRGPIFTYTTLLHPHTPYYPPKWCIRQVFGKNKINKMAFRVLLDFHGWENGNYGEIPEAIDSLKKLYQAELVYADFLFGKLIAFLTKENLYDNTIIVLTSDHGELLGEHGSLNHGGTVWEEVYQVPLIITYPKKINGGRVVDSITSNLDIFPSLLDLIDAPFENQEKMPLDGLSLFSSSLNGDRYLVIDSPPIVLPGRLKAYPKIMETARTIERSIISKQYKYIWSSDGKEYLFKFGVEESDSNNIAGQHPSVVKDYKEKMLQFYKSIHPDYELDHYPIRLSKSMGKKFGNPLITAELKKLGYL